MNPRDERRLAEDPVMAARLCAREGRLPEALHWARQGPEPTFEYPSPRIPRLNKQTTVPSLAKTLIIPARLTMVLPFQLNTFWSYPKKRLLIADVVEFWGERLSVFPKAHQRRRFWSDQIEDLRILALGRKREPHRPREPGFSSWRQPDWQRWSNHMTLVLVNAFQNISMTLRDVDFRKSEVKRLSEVIAARTPGIKPAKIRRDFEAHITERIWYYMGRPVQEVEL